MIPRTSRSVNKRILMVIFRNVKSLITNRFDCTSFNFFYQTQTVQKACITLWNSDELELSDCKLHGICRFASHQIYETLKYKCVR